MKYTHIPISCAAVLAAFLLGVNPWLAWLIMAVFWASHEWTQAEYRWIENLGTGKRESMPWWGGFDPRVWGFKSLVLDMFAPAVVSAGLAWVLVEHL